MKKEVDLIFCSFVPVGLDDYVKYFIKNFDNFTYLKWKFPHSNSNTNSSFTKYNNGSIISEMSLFSLPTFQQKFLYFLVLPFNYFLYVCQSLTLLWKRDNKNTVLFIGVNYFCTFCGILLKKIGKVDVVVYRVMDFFPLPPGGIYRYINRIFYILDRFCLNNSDHIWFTTEGHIAGREKYGYFNRAHYEYKIIPLGLDSSRSISKPINDQSRYSLVYCGVISKYHLIDLLFEVIQDLKSDFSNIKLNLIGSGPDEKYFKELAEKMGLQNNVIFHGFVEDGEHFSELMSNNIVGIALYRDEENFMKYTEPAKVKFYLNFGVPALVSKVPAIASELDEMKVCFAVNNNRDEVVNVVKKLISNKNLQNDYKENVKKYVKTVDIVGLLDDAFFETFGWVRGNV